MARVFIDGFEAGDLKLWDTKSAAAAVSTGITGMDGTYCLNLNGISESIQKNLPEASEYYVAFRYRCTAATSSAYGSIMGFYNGTTLLAALKANYLGVFEAYRFATLIASGGSFAVNTTYLIEVRYIPANSGGVFQVKVNGLLVIDFSGDTTNSATIINSIRFGGGILSYVWAYLYVDNVVVDNAAWPGNTYIQAIKPIGAGNSTQWTPSAGDNYACVDEVPPSETDFVSTNTAAHLDTYGVGALVGMIGSVKCVQLQALAKAEGSPTPTNIQLAVRSGAVDYVSPNKAVPTVSTQLAAIWETDPATGVPWTESAVNAAEIGVKAVA